MAGKSGVDFLRRGTVSPVLGSGDRERVCGCVELGWTRLGTEGGSGMGEGPEGEGPYGLEAGLGGRACSALCWRSRMLRSRVQLLYLDGSALLSFLRDSPVFGTSGQRESRDYGASTSSCSSHLLQILEILHKSCKERTISFPFCANRWILSVPSHFETQSRPTQGFPSLWPTWTPWGHLRWQW